MFQSSQRLLSTKQVCDSKPGKIEAVIIKKHLPKLIVEDKHKLLYCSLPKSGSTNWKRILFVLSGRLNMTTAMNLSKGVINTQASRMMTLAHHSQEEITNKLRSYTKFMFVREPMERLISAYKDKFVYPNTYYPKAVGKRIIKAHRVNASDESLKRGHDVTFSEFVRFLLRQNKLGNPLDWHWDLQSRVCKPCLVDYDFIGTQETITKDTEELIRIAHIENIFSELTAKKKNTTSAIIRETFVNITAQEKRQLIEMYSVDYTMFGYPAPKP